MAKKVPLVAYIEGQRVEVGYALITPGEILASVIDPKKDERLWPLFKDAGAFSIAPLYPPRPKKADDS